MPLFSKTVFCQTLDGVMWKAFSKVGLFMAVLTWQSLMPLMSCQPDQLMDSKEERSENVVLISEDAPVPGRHYSSQDSVGQEFIDTTGPYSPVQSPIFTYVNPGGNLRQWAPKPAISDTMVIPCHQERVELSIHNVWATMETTFLLEKGDTVIFDYPNQWPRATIVNRTVSDTALNYNRFRQAKLFNNGWTTHSKVLLGILSKPRHLWNETTLYYYQESIKASHQELQLLRDLLNKGVITDFEYGYRKSCLEGLMERHKQNRLIGTWLENHRDAEQAEMRDSLFGFDWSDTDSLMIYSFFRKHLDQISQYDLDVQQSEYPGGGGSFIDSKARFDMIIEDPRFNRAAKEFLLEQAFHGIVRNDQVADIHKYFGRLQRMTTDQFRLTELIEKYQLDFTSTDQLLMTDLHGNQVTLDQLLKKHRGKWMYIDFWASWCRPCRDLMPHSRRLESSLATENIMFVFLALNDDKEKWREAITHAKIPGDHYFIENSNTSQVLGQLQIHTIPHYLIYDPSGELVNAVHIGLVRELKHSCWGTCGSMINSCA